MVLTAQQCRHPEAFGAVNTIEGFDVVGEVVEVGSEQSNFKIGDKVVTFTRGIGPRKSRFL
jgi:NADPH:quinone reductase-like Zn-dependent oxidoreductase